MIALSLAVLIILLQIADYWLTTKVLAKGGTELNPIMYKLMQIFGRQTGLILSKLYTSVFVLVGVYLGWFVGTTGLLILVGLAAIYAWVVWHNLVQYRKH